MSEVTCPKCDETFPVTMDLHMARETQMTMTLAPPSGSVLSAEHVGAAIRSHAKLLKAIGRDHGFRSEIVLTGLTLHDNNAVEVKVQICRVRDSEDHPEEDAQ